MIDRIKKILAGNNISPSKFADEIGVQRSAVSHIMSGRNKPSLDFIMKILDRWPDISADWLIRGNGKMKAEANLFSDTETQKKDFVHEKQVNPAKASQESSVADIVQRTEKKRESKSLVKVILLYSDLSFEEYSAD